MATTQDKDFLSGYQNLSTLFFKQLMKYSIIIPCYNKPELTRACIESVEKNTTDYEIIIVDNGSKKPFKSKHFVLRLDNNVGFPKACNQGIKKSSGDVIVLLGNDTIVSPNWLDHLSVHLENYDLVGPLCNSVSGVQMLTLSGLSLPAGLNELAETVYKASCGRSMPYHRIVFFCVAIKKEVFEKIGFLDEAFSPGNCEDDDFCLRAISAGFKLGVAQDTFIYHVGSATFNDNASEYGKLLAVNMQKLMSKYPEKLYNELVVKNLANCSLIPKPAKKTLALVMVVKNEEKGLERAILSVKDFVDQIVIAVDNSSTDKTLEIAKKYATTLKTFDWKDDFSWARNFAHEGIISDFFLFLDGHEFVIKHKNLEQMLNTPADGLLCTVKLEGGADIRNPRIYRQGLKFEGRVHEMQNCRSLAVYSDFVVQHGRIGGQDEQSVTIRDVQRNDQLERIMGEEVKKNPRNLRSVFHYALHKQSMGDFKSALKLQKLYFKVGIMKGERWYVYFNRVLCHFALGNYWRALRACSSADKECPGRWEIKKLRGLIYFQKHEYQKAVKYLVDSFDENIGDEAFKPMARDNASVWNLIGECYFQLDLNKQASVAFKTAFKQEKNGKLKKFYYDRSRAVKQIK